MNIFQFIKELKLIECDWDGIIEFEDLVTEWLARTKAVEIECIEVPLLDKEEYLIWWTWIIKFEIDLKGFEIRLTCLFEKERHRIDLYQEDHSGKMTKIPLPDEVESEDSKFYC